MRARVVAQLFYKKQVKSPSTGAVNPTERVKIWHAVKEHLPMSLHRAVIRLILIRITSFVGYSFSFAHFTLLLSLMINISGVTYFSIYRFENYRGLSTFTRNTCSEGEAKKCCQESRPCRPAITSH